MPRGDPGPPPRPCPKLRFEAIYRAHFAFVWRTLRHHGVPERGLEDAAHEVFIVLYRRFGDYEGQAKMTTLLYGIARRVASNQRRSQVRSDRRKDVAPAPSAYCGPEEHLRAREARDIVSEFLSSLQPGAAEVFRLSQIEGASAPEIAEMLGLNVNTVHTRIRTAKRRFADHVAGLEARAPGLVPAQGSHG